MGFLSQGGFCTHHVDSFPHVWPVHCRRLSGCSWGQLWRLLPVKSPTWYWPSGHAVLSALYLSEAGSVVLRVCLEEPKLPESGHCKVELHPFTAMLFWLFRTLTSIVGHLQTDSYFDFQGLTGNPGVQGPEGKLGPLVSNLNQCPRPLIFLNRHATYSRLMFLIM